MADYLNTLQKESLITISMTNEDRVRSLRLDNIYKTFPGIQTCNLRNNDDHKWYLVIGTSKWACYSLLSLCPIENISNLQMSCLSWHLNKKRQLFPSLSTITYYTNALCFYSSPKNFSLLLLSVLGSKIFQ